MADRELEHAGTTIRALYESLGIPIESLRVKPRWASPLYVPQVELLMSAEVTAEQAERQVLQLLEGLRTPRAELENGFPPEPTP